MVEDFNAGRARCHTQWGDDEETTQVAIELCPVECIYWVKRSQLPVLEYAMKGCKREDIAIMARRRSGNMGSPPSGQNPFAAAEQMLRLRREGKAFADAAAAESGRGGGCLLPRARREAVGRDRGGVVGVAGGREEARVAGMGGGRRRRRERRRRGEVARAVTTRRRRLTKRNARRRTVF
jgi:ferredoxin